MSTFGKENRTAGGGGIAPRKTTSLPPAASSRAASKPAVPPRSAPVSRQPSLAGVRGGAASSAATPSAPAAVPVTTQLKALIEAQRESQDAIAASMRGTADEMATTQTSMATLLESLKASAETIDQLAADRAGQAERRADEACAAAAAATSAAALTEAQLAALRDEHQRERDVLADEIDQTAQAVKRGHADLAEVKAHAEVELASRDAEIAALRTALAAKSEEASSLHQCVDELTAQQKQLEEACKASDDVRARRSVEICALRTETEERVLDLKARAEAAEDRLDTLVAAVMRPSVRASMAMQQLTPAKAARGPRAASDVQEEDATASVAASPAENSLRAGTESGSDDGVANTPTQGDATSSIVAKIAGVRAEKSRLARELADAVSALAAAEGRSQELVTVVAGQEEEIARLRESLRSQSRRALHLHQNQHPQELSPLLGFAAADPSSVVPSDEAGLDGGELAAPRARKTEHNASRLREARAQYKQHKREQAKHETRQQQETLEHLESLSHNLRSRSSGLVRASGRIVAPPTK